jgi:hypothetical protein
MPTPNSLPDDAAGEDVQYSMYVRDRVERGRREADEGKLILHDEVEKRMSEWLRRIAWHESAWHELECTSRFIARGCPRNTG